MRIAVIGSGISGLTCAYLLSPQHDVVLFEQNDYIGGHTATKDVTVNGRHYAIDTGFIVFNDRTYPHFLKLLERLGITGQPTEMSFSVKHLASGLEYNGHTLNSLFAQRRNLISPRFYRFVGEILRFNRCAREALSAPGSATLTLADFLREHRFSDYFAQNYILPMGAAIWSTSLNDFLQFPLGFFLRFFDQHGLLNVTNRPQWYVLPGGSRCYIPSMLAGLPDGNIRLNQAVAAVRRSDDGVLITRADGRSESFDHVIFACHSDQALHMLQDASAEENAILGAIPYQDNDVVLHTDSRLLPQRKLAHASWNYLLTGEPGEAERPATVSYSMNILQGIHADTDFLVTLNDTGRIAPECILGRYTYAHPTYTVAGMAARLQRPAICGVGRTHFCGAYWYNGFHEDGVKSALDVCRRFGAEL